MEIALIIVILVYSIILHEISHGVVALWNGDTTARDSGRLSLNPLRHVDPVGTVILPAILVLLNSGLLFGWAKPVPVDPSRFRNKPLGVFTVGIAGPMTNLLLAVLCAAGLRSVPQEDPVWPFLLYGASANLFLMIFNLVPIPPLDGSRAVGVFLPAPVRQAYYSLERFGFIILIALLYTGALHRFIMPVYRWLFFLLTGYET